MRTYFDCIPCFIRQSIEAVRMVTDDKAVQEKLIRCILKEISRMDFQQTPPHMAAFIHRQIKSISDNKDPYQEIKRRFNRTALDMYGDLEQIVKESGSQFEAAVRLSIAGNIIDFGVRADIDEDYIKATVEECIQSPIIFNTPDDLKQDIDRSEKILFLGDNAGEIVFDKLLISRMPHEKTTYVVKGHPIINDATIEDAVEASMTELVRVIQNGSDAPGTIVDSCSADFIEEFSQADLIIAKGQGNYETLSHTKNKKIYFLLKVKCSVIAADLGCDSGSVVIKRILEEV